MIVWHGFDWGSLVGEWYIIPDPDEDMKDRDGDPLPDPLPDRLRDIAEQVINKGKAQQGIDALDRIVHPPESDAERGARNLNKTFK